MLDTSRYNNAFISCSRPRLLQLGQTVVAEDVTSSSDSDQHIEVEPADYQQASLTAPVRSAAKKTGRSTVALGDLVDAKLLIPRSDCVVVSYKGTTYTASLDDDGAIAYEGKRFNSATAFSMHCKRLQTPGKQGDDGWKSVQYAGKSLDTYRRAYLRMLDQDRRQPGGAAGSSSPEPADDVENGEALLEGEEVPVEGEETEQWVECDRCKLWRVVPDAHWQDVQADKRSSWLCEYAQWDLEGWPPHKPACSQE